LENKSLIKGLVFDTTSVNSGVLNGIVSRMETYVGRGLLQLACRHHIFELCCGAAADLVFDKSVGPEEKMFNDLKSVWQNMDKGDLRKVNIGQCSSRFVKTKADETLRFCQDYLESSGGQSIHLRKDYKELVVLTILFLGGTVPDGVSTALLAPGATTHCRWMAKILYTVKIAP
jgi:hypothetical protein